jgi:ureidoglycolate lyase
MMEIRAEALQETAFAPYGRIYRLAQGSGDAQQETDVIRTEGPGWSDAYTAAPLLSTNGSLGLTRGGPSPFSTHRMERHLHTEEALFCTADPIVLAVAAPCAADQPPAASVRAFVIEPGTAVVLHKGTWHDACRGVEKPAYYYWMATTGTGASSPWMDVKDGPVRVSVDPAIAASCGKTSDA